MYFMTLNLQVRFQFRLADFFFWHMPWRHTGVAVSCPACDQSTPDSAPLHDRSNGLLEAENQSKNRIVRSWDAMRIRPANI